MSLGQTTIDDVFETFDLMDEWEDRYRYLIELGEMIEGLSDDEKAPEHKVRGCTSQVWMVADFSNDTPPRISFRGESDALIVKGLVAVLFLIYHNKTPQEILDIDAKDMMGKLGLSQHLSPMRTNGLFAMIQRIQDIAKANL
ncbi:MAG: SufE family protein [Sphingomonadales bacterium]|nr:SufE family protein [Sphingomonadales bacterium]